MMTWTSECASPVSPASTWENAEWLQVSNVVLSEQQLTAKDVLQML